MLLKTKSGRIVELPSNEEESAINAGIAADSDTYELSDAEFAQLKPMGRPLSRHPLKVATTIRFDADVLDALKATGKGWQTRVNEVVRAWVKSHPIP